MEMMRQDRFSTTPFFAALALALSVVACAANTDDAGTNAGTDAGTDAGPALDTTAPTVGTPISKDGTSGTVVKLAWGAASDDVTAAAALRYAIIVSTAANIGTVAEAEANGVMAMPWLPGVTSFVVDTGITFSMTYYITVLVKDAAGNTSSYEPISLTTESSGAIALNCPDGGVAVGVYGRTGAWFDKLGVVCASVSGTTVGAASNGPSIGGDGGTEFSFTCPAGSVLAEVQGANGTDNVAGWCRTDTTISHRYDCRDVASGQRTGLTPKYGEERVGDCDALASGAFSYTCDAGKSITGIVVNADASGQYVGFTTGVSCR